MSVVTDNLKDVVCERCKRVIGQRDGALLIQFGFKTLFPKSGEIFCPFIGCGFGQIFRVNKDKPRTKVKAFC